MTGPPSDAQLSMWLAEQARPGSATYVLSVAVDVELGLHDELDDVRIRRAVQHVINSNGALRTRFIERDGGLVRVVEDVVPADVEVVGAEAWTVAEVDAFVDREHAIPFELERAPLLRVRVLRRRHDRAVLVLTLHHLVADLWTIALIGDQLASAFDQLGAGREPASIIARSYDDFVAEERAYARTEAGSAARDYWADVLRSLQPLDVSLDRGDPDVPRGEGEVTSIEISDQVWSSVRQHAAERGVPARSLVLASYLALIHRLSGASSPHVLELKANRSARDARTMGLFANQVVRTVTIGLETTLDNVRDAVVDQLATSRPHEFLPFGELARDLGLSNVDGMFELGFAWQKTTRAVDRSLVSALATGTAGSTTAMGAVGVAPHAAPHRSAPLPLLLIAAEHDAGLRLAFEYEKARFDARWVERTLRRLQVMLEAMGAAPMKAVGAVDIVLPDERAAWHRRSSPPAAQGAPPPTVVEMFLQNVDRDPDAPAIRYDGETLTYGMLDERANRIAARLRMADVNPGDRVGVCVDRSPDMVAAIIAIWELGAAYVPLDPALPDGRTQMMLEDGGVRTTLVSGQAAQRLVGGQGWPTTIVDLDLAADRPPADRHNETTVARSGTRLRSPHDLAYVIFTSGSTGRPKGVEVEHGNVSHFVTSIVRVLGLGRDDTVLASTTLSFDPCVLELIAPLTIGATIGLLRDECVHDPAHLATALGDVTVAQGTPTMWQMLIASGWSGAPDLTILCGGEVLKPQLAHDLARRGKQVWNLYGPTEATVWTTAARIGRIDRSIPLGHPLPGTALHVLDEHLRPVPDGVIGELWVGGPSVTRGYCGSPELTARTFHADPWDAHGGRMYRTGDLVRRRIDGSLVFHGRVDHQVKIRGHRIELGEIEATLDQHPHITASAVTTHHPTPDDTRLIAYITTPPNTPPPTTHDIRTWCQRTLPDHMIPTTVVPLDTFPLTTTNKIDRNQLPPPPTTPHPNHHEPPHPGLETDIATIWTDILGTPTIGRHDNFFHLGGHSLLATRAASRLRHHLGRNTSVSTIFEHPTLASLAVALRDDAAHHLTLPAVERLSGAGAHPLTYSQERMWLLHQLDPEDLAYHITVAARLRGPLNVDVLRQSTQTLVARHETLRTVFEVRDGQPVQRVIDDDESVGLTVVDLAHLPAGERLAAATAALTRDATQPFRLDQLPLVRLVLYRLSDDDHLALMTMHHIIGDEWAFGLMLQELTHLYNRAVRDEPVRLPDVAVRPAEYARWHRRIVTEHLLDDQLRYWIDQLANAPVTELPTARARQAQRVTRGANVRASFPDGLDERLAEFCRERGVSKYMVLLAAFQLMTGRLAGTRDVTVGTPLANRNWLESEVLVASTVNTVVIRTDLTGEPSFDDLLARVRRSTLEAFENQDLPFARVVTELGTRSRGQGELFRNFFNVLTVPFGQPTLDGIDAEQVVVDRGATQFELSLTVDLHNAIASIEYDATLFGHVHVERLLDRYWQLVGAALDDPTRSVALLPVLLPAERHALREEWSGSVAPRAQDDAPIHRIILDRAQQWADRIAIRCGTDTITYGQLDPRSRQIARALVDNGVARGDRIGIIFSRSTDLVPAVLAVLRSGAAFVPLDPELPVDRLRYMADDAGCTALVTNLDGEAPADGMAIIELRADQPAHVATDREANERLLDDATAAGDLAYVIYTSGSTGRPKGVVIDHRNLRHFVDAALARLGIGPADVVLAMTPLSFDPSILELLAPLVVGAEVDLVPGPVTADSYQLNRYIARSSATFMQATPTRWRMLIESGWKGSPNSTVVTGGEILTPDLACALSSRAATVWNAYGPTETTVWSTFEHIREPSDAALPLPIGSPLPGTRLYVLDGQQQPVPDETVGEIFIAGGGVARGYHGRPDLTSERFVSDPFHPGELMYRTGDLGHRSTVADGGVTYYFHGRVDHQVKIRGHRIELGEIEATLDQHPHITASAVTTHHPTPDDTRLIAYITTTPNTPPPTTHDIRTWCQRTLPDHMIPTTVVPLDTFPLTTTNKIDRNQLPPPPTTPHPNHHQPPHPGLETDIATIWADLLGTTTIERHDNFFHLGGHSLLATRAASRLRHHLGRNASVSAIFEHPTLASLAVALRDDVAQNLTLPAVERLSGAGAHPLTYSQERMWFLHQLDPEGLAYHITVAARLRGPLNVDVLRQSTQTLVERHETLRTIFEVRHGQPVQRVIDGDKSVGLTVVDLANLPAGDRLEVATAALKHDATQPFRLDQLPLVRLVLYRLSEDDHVALVTMHHIIGDEWAFGLMLQELAHLYNGALRDEPVRLPDVAIRPAEYAHWHRRIVTEHLLDHQLRYWMDRLVGAPVTELPTAVPRQGELSARGANVRAPFPDGLDERLADFCRERGVSKYMVLLTAFQLMTGRLAGTRDVTVGTPIANRNWLESEVLVASTVNTVVIRTDLTGEPSFDDLLARVRRSTLEAFENQDLPFARVVTELGARSRGQGELFRNFFNVLTVPFGQPTLDGIDAEQIVVDRGATQFELSMTVDLHNAIAAIEYDATLFGHVDIERLLERYWQLVGAALDNPTRSVALLPVLLPAEQHALREEWSESAAPRAQDDAPIHRIILDRAQQYADRIAIRCDTDTITYGQLDDRSRVIARALVDNGVLRGDRVGIMISRSTDLVAAVLAVLRSGAAFVPLDPELPVDRLRYMAGDAGCTTLLTDLDGDALADGMAIIELRADRTARAANDREADARLLDDVTAGDVAYVIYTSGSTGQPKGVVIDHRNLRHFVDGALVRLGISAADVVLAMTPLSFDPSILELLAPLVVGAQIDLVPGPVAADSYQLNHYIARSSATFMQATPTRWRMLIESGWKGSPSCTIVTGGEILTPDLACELSSRSAAVWNAYGPTETTVWSTFEHIRESSDSALPLPIGSPLPGTRLYVLDDRQQPVTDGTIGEIFIAGGGVARGYHGRPDLTSERFVSDPFHPGELMYRTGDLGHRCTDADGRVTYYFHGRVDHQVKIRGHRIELGEIEATLDQHPHITASAVTTHHPTPDDTRLIAYITTTPNTPPPTTHDIRTWCQHTLPDHMIPTTVVPLDTFPLTTTNKIDRNQLPPPPTTPHPNHHEPPHPGLETDIATIWADLLGTTTIGRHDNFFHLGGHSLLAVRMVAEVERRMGVQLALSSLFRAPTVAELAGLVEKGDVRRWTSLVPVQPHGAATPVFYVAPYLITSLSFANLGQSLAGRPLYVLQPQGVDTADPAHTSVEAMAAHYIEELRQVQPSGPFLIGGHCAGATVAAEMAHQLEAGGEQVSLLLLVDALPPSSEPSRRSGSLRRVIRYLRDGRFRFALQWQLHLLHERIVQSRFGTPVQIRIARLRRVHAAAHASYRPGVLACNITLIHSAEWSEPTHRDRIERGWTGLTTGTVHVRSVPGTHAGLVEMANSADLGRALEEAIALHHC